MMRVKVQKVYRWLVLLASSGLLLQAAPAGCPNGAAFKGALSTGIQSIITGLIGAYVKDATNQIFGVNTTST